MCGERFHKLTLQTHEDYLNFGGGVAKLVLLLLDTDMALVPSLVYITKKKTRTKSS